jgi:UDP-glucose 4-epimerase
MRILLSGGAGFIGSQVADAYLAAGHAVAIIDDLSTGKREHIPAGATFYEGSITDPSFLGGVCAQFRPEVVNHHAAQATVIRSLREPAQDAQINVLGTIALVEAVKSAGAKKFIYIATGGAGYGNPERIPCDEETPSNPLSPYGLSKHMGERYVRLLCGLAGMPWTVLRYGNVYGPRQDPHGENNVCAIFAPRMLKGEPVSIFGDGTQTRDYLYVGDAVAANLLALEKADNEYLNIATGQGTTTMEVFRTLQAATNYGQEAEMKPERPGEIQAVVLDVAKAERLLGWKPETSFKQGVGRTVAWYREQKTV